MNRENTNYKTDIACELLRMRLTQTIINEHYKNKAFKVPIHLAFGHEAIAIAVGEMMSDDDRLIVSHRNIHYNMARGAQLRQLMDEYLLKPEGLSGGKQGSMNLSNPERGIPYASSILGNNFGVAVGAALAIKAKKKEAVACVVTGDGAMEEGSFYEALLMFSGQKMPSVIIIENNEWSLASTIEERRAEIDVKSLAQGAGAGYVRLTGNNVFDYIDKMQAVRNEALKGRKCVVVEVILKSLGDWRLKTDDFPDGKFINYHAGPAPTIELEDWPVIHDNEWDPLAVLSKLAQSIDLKQKAVEMKADLLGAIA